jgi:predicted nucleic acid-binding protein
MVIACAIALEADCIVTRDRDLLDLGHHGKIAILAPEAFLARLRGQ